MSDVLAGYMFVIADESFVVEGMQDECSSHYCCRGTQDSAVVVVGIELGTVWESRIVGEVGIHTAAAAGLRQLV